jgi:hypothetical protein
MKAVRIHYIISSSPSFTDLAVGNSDQRYMAPVANRTSRSLTADPGPVRAEFNTVWG